MNVKYYWFMFWFLLTNLGAAIFLSYFLESNGIKKPELAGIVLFLFVMTFFFNIKAVRDEEEKK